MDYLTCFVLAAIIVLGAALFLLVSKKLPSKLDINKYRIKYLEIENSLMRDNSSSYHLSVLNADKLVDMALKERKVRGETMGERMKNAKNLLSNNDGVWFAHKLRNRIAHDDVKVSYDQAARALAEFRRALKDLGAI